MHVEGLPLGTRGGLLVEHLFPADGDYKLNINGLAAAGYLRGMEYQHTLVVTIDGVKVFEAQIGGEEDLKAIDQQQAPAVAAINGRFQNIPVKVTAGPHKVGVTFVARTLRRVRRRAVLVPAGRRRGAHPESGQRRGARPVQPAGLERHAEPPARSSSAGRPQPAERRDCRARRRSCRRSRAAPSAGR